MPQFLELHIVWYIIYVCTCLGGFWVTRTVLWRNPCCVSQSWSADLGIEDIKGDGSLHLPSKKYWTQWLAFNTENEWLKAFVKYTNFRWHSRRRTDFLIMTMHSVISAWGGGTVQSLDEERKAFLNITTLPHHWWTIFQLLCNCHCCLQH